MKLLLLLLFLISVSLSCCTQSTKSENIQESEQETSFSQWMNYGQLDSFVSNKIADSFYVLIAEGRLNNRNYEYRVYMAHNPAKEFYWFWWLLRSKSEFDSLCSFYDQDSIDLIAYQAFKDTLGVDRYQATWRKIVH